jgi:hypothetical protein
MIARLGASGPGGAQTSNAANAEPVVDHGKRVPVDAKA